MVNAAASRNTEIVRVSAHVIVAIKPVTDSSVKRKYKKTTAPQRWV